MQPGSYFRHDGEDLAGLYTLDGHHYKVVRRERFTVNQDETSGHLEVVDTVHRIDVQEYVRIYTALADFFQSVM